jgi:hypothetical protein
MLFNFYAFLLVGNFATSYFHHQLDLLAAIAHSMRHHRHIERHLRALIIITNTDAALRAETMGPETTELNIAVGQFGVGDEQPGAEDGLGQDIKDSVGNDFLVNIEKTGTIGNTPYAV